MPLPIGSQMPSLDGCTEWVNRTLSPSELRGHPVIVYFWAISCPICKMNMPRLQELTRLFDGFGLILVSIHMPRGEEDQDITQVKMVAGEIGLIGPCAIDNAHTLGDRFETGGVWPCYFLYDAEGKLRSRASGQLGLKMAENSLKRLLELEGMPA